MTFWIILAVVLIVAALAWRWSTKRKVKTLDDENNLEAWRPRTIRPLTKLELKALGQIQTAAPHWVVLPQVSLSRFLKVKTSLPYGPWFYKVGRRCVDFLICSKGGDVLGVIELQTNTTLQSHISSGVLAKERTLTQASIPIWHFNPESPDALEQLHALIHVKTSDSIGDPANGPDFRPTDTAPRGAGIEAIELDDTRWEQAWPTEDTRPTAFLDLAEENQSLDNVKIT
jgi:hypothetical protein